MAEIVVIGSANMDTVYSVRHIPAPGETITSRGVMQNAGGKGANQAVAAGRLGGQVAFVGAVGADAAGDALAQSLTGAGVDVSALARVGAPTGSAFICVADSGENSIVVHPGANGCVDAALIDGQAELIGGAQMCVMQLEVPHEAIWHAVELCSSCGVKVMLNPSPVAGIPAAVLAATDVLVPNEHEAEALLGCEPDAEALRAFCARTGVGRVVMTMGSHGVWSVTSDEAAFYPCRKAKAVDTTGAGDCFLGALAAALAAGRDMDGAIRFAMAASAIAVTRPGAQQAMPSLGEVEAALNDADGGAKQ